MDNEMQERICIPKPSSPSTASLKVRSKCGHQKWDGQCTYLPYLARLQHQDGFAVLRELIPTLAFPLVLQQCRLAPGWKYKQPTLLLQYYYLPMHRSSVQSLYTPYPTESMTVRRGGRHILSWYTILTLAEILNICRPSICTICFIASPLSLAHRGLRSNGG